MTYEEIRKKHIGGASQVKSQSDTSSSYYALRVKHGLNDEVDEEYINSYIRDFNSYANSSQKDYNGLSYKTARNYSQKYREASDDLAHRANNIKGYLQTNKDSIDSKTYGELQSYLKESGNALDTTRRAFDEVNKFYSQWETEDDYNDYLKSIEEKEELLKLDTKTAKAEIDNLDSKIADLESNVKSLKTSQQITNGYNNPAYAGAGMYGQPAINWSVPGETQNLQKQIDVAEKELVKLRDERNKKNVTYNRATHLQTADKLYNTAINATDFEQMSDKGANNKLATKKAEYESGYVFGEATTLSLEQRFAKYATDEEMDIYSYYIGKGDEASAQAFLTSMEETINARKGLEIYEAVEDNIALEMAFGVAAGLNQFATGIGNLFDDKDYYAPSATAMASASVREDLYEVGGKLPDWMGGSSSDENQRTSYAQAGYDFITTTANMLPSILASYAVTYLSKGALGAEAAAFLGQSVGSLTLGTSAAGNAYAEMINLGYDKGQAKMYATLVGGSEAGLQYIMGGVGKLGGIAKSGKKLMSFVDNIDNAFAKTAIKFGSKVIPWLSEGAEEYTQEILDPFFKNLAFNESNEIKLYTPEALYSGVLGAFSAGLLDGVPNSINAGVNATRTYQTGKTLTKNNNFDVKNLVELGNKMSADSVAYKVANKVNDKTGAYTIGKLFHAIGAELSVQNQQDIVKSLTLKGVAPENAETIADWLGATVNGAKLTKQQINALELNEDIANTFRDVIINPNSTINQRRQAWFEAGGFDVASNADADMNAYSPDAVMDRINESQMLTTQSAPSLETQLAQLAQEKASKSTEAPTAEQSNPFIPLAKQTAPVQNTEKIKALDSVVAKEHDVSDIEGKTIIKNTNEAVNIKKITSIDKNSMTLELDDGREVSSRDISYASEGEALVYETVADITNSAESANAIINAFDVAKPKNANAWAAGARMVYTDGKNSIPFSEIAQQDFTSYLSNEAKKLIYNLGQQDAITETAKAEKAKKTTNKKAKGKGRVTFEGKENFSTDGFTDVQRASVAYANIISKITGVEVRLYESEKVNGRFVYTDENGEVKAAPNGKYIPGSNIIMLDINAGINGEGTMLYTLAHELTHYIKEWSPAKFKSLANFLMEQYGKQGRSVDELVQAQIRKAKSNRKTIDYDTAYEEVIADSMEAMLVDGKVIEKLQQLYKQDKSLYRKIVDFVNKWVDKVKQVYTEYSPDSKEGKLVLKMLDTTERLQELFAEAIMDASVNYKSAVQQVVESKARKAVNTLANETLAAQLNENGLKLSDRDSNYMTAVNNGDLETAQRLVDEAAREAGYSVRAMHSTNADFTVFDISKTSANNFHGKGIYFTSSLKDLENNYENYEGPDPWQKIEDRAYELLDEKHGLSYDDTLTGDAEIIDLLNECYDEAIAEFNDSQRRITAYLKFDNPFVFEKGDDINASVDRTVYDGIVDKQVYENIGHSGMDENTVHYIVFNPNNIKSSAPVTYDDNGNVIPLSKRFDSSESDIRYSDRDYSFDPELVADLQADRDKLKADVANLKELLKLQRTETHGTMFTKTSVNAAASKLMKTFGVNQGKPEIVLALNDFYKYVASSENLNWDSIMEEAGKVANRIVEITPAREQRDDYAEKVLKEIRTVKISLSEEQKSEIANKYDSYNNFRKAHMGSMVLSDKGISLEKQWQEWAELYPDVFDKDVTAADMPEALAEITSDLRLTRKMVNELNTAEQKQMMANEVYDSYWGVSTLHTLADRHQKQVNLLKSKHNAQMSELRAESKEREQKTTERYREMIKRIREHKNKQMEEYKVAVRESRQNATESRHRTEMRNKIKKVVNELNQYLLNGTKDKHVMEGMQKAVAEALSIVNMDTVDADARVAKYDALIAEATDPDIIESLTATRDRIQGQGDRLADKLASLKSAYADVINSSDPTLSNAYDEVIEAKIASVVETVGDTPLRNMSMSQLEEVYDLYKMVLTNIRNANKLFASEKQETIEQLGYEVDSEIKAITKQKDKMTDINQMIRKFSYKELKPIYFFRMLGSDTMTDLYRKVRDGQNTWERNMEEAKEFRINTEKKHSYKEWDLKKTHTFTAKSGKSFDLTLSQIMSIYAFSRREQALDHLIKGGIVFDDAVKVKKKKGSPISYTVNTSEAFNLSADTLGKIVDTLTEEQKSYVKDMQSYLSDTMGAKGNEVSLKLYGVKLFKEKNYFPLKSSQYYMNFTAEEAGETKIKNSSFSKETVKHANNPIVLSDFIDVWANHVNDMSMYHSFVLPLEDFTRVYNYRTPTSEDVETTSVKSTIHNHYTEAANSYIKQLLKDINGGSVSGVGTEVIDKMVGLAKKGAVMASWSVTLQQPSAVFRAMDHIDSKYFINASTLNLVRHKKLWKECKQYAPIAGIKEMGYFDTSVGRTGIDWLKADEYDSWFEKAFATFHSAEQFKANFNDALSWAPSMADELSWVFIWEAVKKETKKTTSLKVGSEEFFKHCGERFTEVVDLTQVYDSVFSRSELMRSKDRSVKMATAFMAEATVQANMIFDSALQLKRGEKSFARAIKTGLILTAAVIVNSLLKSPVGAGRDDDEYESYLEKILGSFAGDVLSGLNPLTLIPFVKDVISIIQGYSVERMDMSVIDSLVTAFLALSKETETPAEEQAKWANFVGAVTQLFGVPIKNIYRDVKGAFNTHNTLTSGNETTETGVKFALLEGLSGTVTGTIASKFGSDALDTSKGKQYYDAVMGGDTAHANKIVASYGDKKKADNAIVDALKNFEPRVVEAAQAHIDGNTNERVRISKEIIADGFAQDYVVKAVNGMVTKLEKGDEESESTSKPKSLYTKEDYFNAAYEGDTSDAEFYKEELIKFDMDTNDKTREEAESSFNSSFKSAVRKAVVKDGLTMEKATRMLADYGGVIEEKAYELAQGYDFVAQHPDLNYDWKAETVAKYLDKAEPAGISVSVYDDYLVKKSQCKGVDRNNDGKADKGTKKAQIYKMIDSLPITSHQKAVLKLMNK